eukprot:311542_1
MKPTETTPNQLDPDEIDDILDELEENEKKKEDVNDDDISWHDILNGIRSKNVNYIKNLISSKQLAVNSRNPLTGKTVLIYAVIIGNMDLVKTVCNFGGDVHIKDDDGLDALDYAIKYGRYKITELVYYRQLSGSLGNDLKAIAMQIHQKNKQAKYIYDKHHQWMQDMSRTFAISALKERAPFDLSLFYYSWYFEVQENGNENVFKSDLWQTMMSVYEEILSNTKDKNGWKWLKEQFIPSLIWYLPHPNSNKQAEEKENDHAMEDVLKRCMFYELLKRVRAESKTQSDLLLKTEIDAIKTAKPNEWTRLISYNVNTKHSQNARQDSCGCLRPIYSEDDLSEDNYPPSTHFSAKKHYDTNIYLNELMFRANIINDLFQNDMKRITKQINQQTGDDVTFRMGPVKTLTRSQVKVNNDYINEAYPTSAKILDINRCALQFNSIQSMMKFINIFTQKVNNKDCGSITQIIRCKNGWSAYDVDYPQYTDIKLNVLLQSKAHGAIIAEIQFLLSLMSKFKKVAHKLYSVERKFELVYNHQLLKEEMERFRDIENDDIIWRQIVNQDNIIYFKSSWESNTPNVKDLLLEANTLSQSVSNHLIFRIMTSKTGQIDRYLNARNKDIYRDALFYFISRHEKSKANDWCSLLNDIAADDRYVFIERVLDLFDDTNALSAFVLFKQWNGSSLFQALWKIADVEALKCVLLDERMPSESEKCKSLAQLFVSEIPSNFSDTLEALRSGANDVQILNTFSMIFDFYKSHQTVDVFQHKAFNYFTFKAPACEDTEFKVIEDTMIHLSGGLRSFGNGDNGRLGLGDDNGRSEPTICTALMKKKIIKIASYYAHSLCIDANGCVFAWGRNEKGQLGLGDCEDRNTPQILDVFKQYNALSVAVGGNHSLILTDEGNVWSCGSCEYGALGYVSKENVLSPKRIDSLNNEHIVHVSCGGYHSCVISKDDKLFTFGDNYYGQCGVGNDNEKIFVPTNVVLTDGLIPAFTACGGSHTLILTTNHDVLSCGSGGSGKLGHGNEDNQNIPKPIEALKSKDIINIAAGQNHSLCVSKDGEVYTFGDGDYGRLGHGNTDNQMVPKEVQFFKDKNIKIRECVGGYYHSGAISMNGEVYLWGKGDALGQGPDDTEHKYIPTKVDYLNHMAVKCVSLGDECSFVVSECIDLKENQSEEKEEEVEKEWILKGDQQMNIKNGNDLRSKAFGMFIRNRMLFGDLEWVMWRRNKAYSA